MLTLGEQNFLSKISSDKTVKIFPYDPQIETIANQAVSSILQKFPDLKVVHMGASALKISGQGDLDIYCLSNPSRFDKYLPELTRMFGQPKSSKPVSIAWNYSLHGRDVELYLTDPQSEPMKRQLAVFDILKNNPQLLSEYEQLKQSLNGKSFREYQQNKYEFYHRILGN